MASTARTSLGRRLRLAVAGAVALTTLTTTTTAIAAAEPPMQTARSGASPDLLHGVRSRTPVFVLDKGRFSTFDAPGEGAGEFQRINNRGEIVGAYVKQQQEPDSVFGGYRRDRRGGFTKFDVPGAVSTTPLDLNDRGQIVGNYQVELGGALRGFLRDARGRYTAIEVPGSVQTQAIGINDHGQIVGDYIDAAGGFHGYLWTRGRFVTIDGPVGTGATLTNLDNRGQIIGVYAPTGDPMRLDGFVLRGGRYTTFDLDDTALTFPLAINDRGQIAGFTADAFSDTADSNLHGFVLRRGVGGPVTRIDAPGATVTGAMGINDQGTIVGLYLNPNAAPSPPTGKPPTGRMA